MTQLVSMRHNDTTLDAHIKVRVPRSLKARLARIAIAKMKKLPEVGREAIKSYVEKEEVGHGIRHDKQAA